MQLQNAHGHNCQGLGGSKGDQQYCMHTSVMSTTSVESSRLSSALRRSGSRKVQERGPGSKKIAAPAERADATASIMTAGGSSSKQQPATNSPRASLKTCGHAQHLY